MSQGPFQELPKIIFSQMPSVQWDVALMEMVTGSSRSRGDSRQAGVQVQGFGQSTAIPRASRVAHMPQHLGTEPFGGHSADSANTLTTWILLCPVNKQVST